MNEVYKVFIVLLSLEVLGFLAYVLIVRRMNWQKRGHSKQTTWVYCPNCDNELTGKYSTVVLDDNHGMIYECLQCGMMSRWDYDAPTPIFLGYVSNADAERLKLGGFLWKA